MATPTAAAKQYHDYKRDAFNIAPYRDKKSPHLKFEDFRFGHPVSEVAVSRDGGYCALMPGAKRYFSNSEVSTLKRREARAQVGVAACCGKAAVDRWYGYRAKGDVNWHGSDDYKRAYGIALGLSYNDSIAAEHLVKHWERLAEMLVEKHWGQVAKLSYALLERQKLTGQEISVVLTSEENFSL